MARVTPDPVTVCDRTSKPVENPKPEGSIAMLVLRHVPLDLAKRLEDALSTATEFDNPSVVVMFRDLSDKSEATLDNLMKRVRNEPRPSTPPAGGVE